MAINRSKEQRPRTVKRADLERSELYINRELSSLEFNRRVLDEARDDYHPLLERVKFLAICGSNLDEFFMSRVSDLRRQMVRGVAKYTPDGLPPANAIDKVREMLGPILAGHAQCWREQICPALKKNGLLTRDARVVDRKKAGKHKARKSTQFSKR